MRSGLDVPTFTTRRLHARHHATASSGGRWNCGRERSRKFCLNGDFHVTFRDLLHAVKIRTGTDGFTFPPKEGVLRIFRPKNPTASAGCEPANLGTKGQHATFRPPKPLYLSASTSVSPGQLSAVHHCSLDGHNLINLAVEAMQSGC